MNIRLTVALIFASAFLLSCAAPVRQQERAGFISDYSNLKESESNAFVYDGPNLNRYTVFYFTEGELLFDPAQGDAEITKDDLEELMAYFREKMIEEVTKDDGYTVVDKPGEGVATVRWGLTAVDATIGVLNVSIATKITGAGLGGAAMEGEIVDSITGEQIAASIRWGSGSRILRAGITKLGDAKIQVNDWARALRRRLDEAHGKSS